MLSILRISDLILSNEIGGESGKTILGWTSVLLILSLSTELEQENEIVTSNIQINFVILNFSQWGKEKAVHFRKFVEWIK